MPTLCLDKKLLFCLQAPYLYPTTNNDIRLICQKASRLPCGIYLLFFPTMTKKNPFRFCQNPSDGPKCKNPVPAHACYLKLLSELGGVALRVHLQHLLIDESELSDGDGGLSAQTGLQDGVVDEHVLLLGDGKRWQS